LSRFDGVVTDQGGVEAFTRQGVQNVMYWNMYGYHPGRLKKDPTVVEDCDILFIGNMNVYVQSERNRLVKRLLDLSNRFRVRVETNLRGEAYVKALQSAKIVFNRSVRGEVNMRVFEALALDKLIFLESDNREIRTLFEPGKECVLYEEETLEETLAFWITNDEARERIIRNASVKKAEYSYPAALDRLHKIIGPFFATQGVPEQRSFNRLSEPDRLYYMLRQSFLASGVKADGAWQLTVLNRLTKTSQLGYHIGLMIFYLCHQAMKGVLGPAEKATADRILIFVKKKQEGRFWNLLNYAQILHSANEFESEIKSLVELVEMLSQKSFLASDFLGAPCFGQNHPFFQELSLAGHTCNDVALRERLLEVSLYRLAHAFCDRGLPDRAIPLLERVIVLQPKNESAHFLLGNCLLSGNREGALDHFREAYRINPFSSDIWERLLSTCVRTGRIQEAQALLLEMRRAAVLSKTIFGFLAVDLEKNLI